MAERANINVHENTREQIGDTGSSSGGGVKSGGWTVGSEEFNDGYVGGGGDSGWSTSDIGNFLVNTGILGDGAVSTPAQNERTVTASAAPKASMASSESRGLAKEDDSKGMIKKADKGTQTASDASLASANTETQTTLVPRVSAEEVASGGTAGVDSTPVKVNPDANELENAAPKSSKKKKGSEKSSGNLLGSLQGATPEEAVKQKEAMKEEAKAAKQAAKTVAKQVAQQSAAAKEQQAAEVAPAKPKAGRPAYELNAEEIEAMNPDKSRKLKVVRPTQLRAEKMADPHGTGRYRNMRIQPALNKEGVRIIDEDSWNRAISDEQRKMYSQQRKAALKTKRGERVIVGDDNLATFFNGDGEITREEYVPYDQSRLLEDAPENPTWATEDGEPVLNVDEDSVHEEFLQDQRERQARWSRSRQACIRILTQPWRLGFMGQHWHERWITDSKGRKRNTHEWYQELSDDAKRSINTIRDLYQCSDDEVMKLYTYAAGLGVDNSNQICGVDADKWTWNDGLIADLTEQIQQSQQVYGHPMGVVGRYVWNGQTRCFPAGYVDSFTLQEISRNPKSALYGKSADEIQADIKATWDEKTMKDLMVFTHKNDFDGKGRAQREAVFNFVRAALEIDGKGDNYAEYGIDPWSDDKCYADCMDEFALNEGVDPAIQSAIKAKMNQESRAKERARKQIARRSKQSVFTDSVQLLTTWSRFASTLHAGVLLSAPFEKLKGCGVSWAANRMFDKYISSHSDVNPAEVESKFERTETLKQLAGNKKTVQCQANLQMLMNIVGPDGVSAFCMDKEAMSALSDRDAVISWLRYDLMRKQEEAKGDVGALAQLAKVQDKMARVTEFFMTGAGMTDGVDCQRFFDNFLLNMKAEYLQNPQAGNIIGTEEILEAVEREGIEAVMCHMCAQHQGRDALLGVNELNMGRRSGVASVIEWFMKEHGLTDATVALLLDKFIKFGINSILLHFPFSATAQYAMAMGILKYRGVDPKDVNISSLSEFLSEWEAVYVGNTMGVDEANGLAKCVLYDMAQLGSDAAVAAFIFLLHALFQGDDDDDPDELQKANPVEWAFGSIKVIPAWWSYDFTGPAYCMGQAMWAWYKTGDAKLAGDIIINGTAEALSGSAVLDTVNLLKSMNEITQAMQEINQNKEGGETNSSYDLSAATYMSYVTKATLAQFLKNITPGFLNDFQSESLLRGSGAKQTSAYKYYKEDGSTAYIDDVNEVLFRTFAKNNVAFAGLLDLMNLTGVRSNEYSQTTGYFWWQMPTATQTDQLSLYWYGQLNVEDGWSTQEKDAAAEKLIDIMNQYGSATNAAAQGFILPVSARNNLKEYLAARQLEYNDAWLDAQIAYKNGEIDYAAKTQAYNNQYAYKQLVNKIYTDWLNNDAVASSMNRYDKLISDTQINYVWTSGANEGQVANALDFFFHPDQVEAKYSQMGNIPSSVLPATFVEDTGKYNQETGSAWYNSEYTDMQAVSDMVGDGKIGLGRDQGSYTIPTIMGSQDDKSMDSERRASEPTANNRRLVANDDFNTLDNASKSDVDESVAATRANIDYNALKNKEALVETANSGSNSSSNYSYSKSYGTGSGSSGKSYSGYGSSGSSKSYSSSGSSSKSSSYSSKIYSSTHNLYSKTAQGMDVKTPYSASTTYLKPGFSTKGSREAYKRSDI